MIYMLEWTGFGHIVLCYPLFDMSKQNCHVSIFSYDIKENNVFPVTMATVSMTTNCAAHIT